MAIIFQLLVHGLCIVGSLAAGCSYLSADAGCGKCDERGHCIRGSVPIDPWLSFALKTQRDLQGHNAFNTRADNYGGNDTCAWPPPYKRPCWAFANQEFSFTDMLNMGIRGFEIDNYWCNNDIRMAHLGSDLKLLCFERTKTFAEGMKEIGDWLKKEGNTNELIRIYLDRPGSDRPDIVNNALLENFGNRIITPLELQSLYNGVWPTMRTLQADGNNVVVLINSNDDLGGVTIHKAYWTNRKYGSFTPYPICGGKNAGRYMATLRRRHTLSYPAMDFVNQQLLKTAVFTWAPGEPSQNLEEESCIYLSGSDRRWHVFQFLSKILYFACQHTGNKDIWTLSETTGRYSLSETYCPSKFKFGIPQNGYRNQKLIELIGERDVWINYSPFLPGYTPPKEDLSGTTPQSSASDIKSKFIIWIIIFSVPLFQRI
ncbi:hypothetical protein BSL78_07871 [Apostichopus japonicus]|uniref:Uncharacterized protein n=1 Tax=Stichopus japonicus TaxID=307972 RepID=A0A2G8L4Z6_STIJA|nr:hypothetical protein BSL78_07871 [Apostichopus japonicus]